MGKQDNKAPKGFASNLFDFLEEEDTSSSLAELKNELRARGIDPDAETAWVSSYVGEQLRTLKAKRIRAASDARTGLLDRLKVLRAHGSAVVSAAVDQLLEQLQSGRLQGLEALQAQFSKLENPTEDDLRGLLTDWVEMEKWGDDAATPEE